MTRTILVAAVVVLLSVPVFGQTPSKADGVVARIVVVDAPCFQQSTSRINAIRLRIYQILGWDIIPCAPTRDDLVKRRPS